MPRTSDYTEAEDDIILSTSGEHADVTNERLVAAGFSPRTPRQLTNRRQHLKRQGSTQAIIRHAGAEQLVKRLKALETQRDKATKLLYETERELAEVASALRKRAEQILSESGVD